MQLISVLFGIIFMEKTKFNLVIVIQTCTLLENAWHHLSRLTLAEGDATAKTARETATMRSRINYSSQFHQKKEKNARDTPLTKKIIIIPTPQYWPYLQHDLFHLNPGICTKKHITMHLLVGSNWEATSASSAYVDGRIAWPI